MAVWETEDESRGDAAVTALPTPQDTPYRTPSRSSRKSRRSATPPNGKKSPSPPPVPHNDKGSKRSSRNMTNEDGISVLDPRRFTPTLHANLVAEILNLRRDQEDKAKLIENLEVSLHASRQEQESLQESAATAIKESRSLQRQLALLEGGTSSAIGELARERDEAVDSITEAKKRLEVAQRKIRSQEEDSQRVHDLWAQDKDSWEEEKRKYERRVHVAESRLKAVLDEVAAYQAAQANGNGHDSETEDQKDNDAASVRTMSMTNSVRFSMQQSPGKVFNGNSLADELNLEGDDDWQTDDGGRESALSYHRHTRTFSRDSVLSRIHRRNQSLESPQRPGSVTRGRLWMNQTVLEALEDGIQEDDEDLMPPPPPPPPKVTYTDTGIQYSPPPSPKLEPIKPATPEPPVRTEKLPEVEATPRGEWEVEANQRRKRVHINRPLAIEPRPFHQMVSAGSQTAEEPLSPPKTPKSPYRSMTPPPESPPTVMVSTSTQTDKPEEKPQSPPVLRPTQELTIPSISIIPPSSRPTTPREPRLPQYFKDFGCQVSIISSVETRSTAVQTEEILSDKRLANLPVHLRPSAITSRPSSPVIATAITTDDPRHFTPVPGQLPPRNPRRLTSKRSLTDMPSSPPVSPVFGEQTRDAYPGNNDDGPLSSHTAPMRRPHRFSSLFAGFQDAQSSDEQDEFDADVSDSEYRTALSAPGMRMTDSRASNRTSVSTFAASPEQTKKSVPMRGSVRPIGTESFSYNLDNRDMAVKKPPAKPTVRGYEKTSVGPSGKQNVMRKAAMIQSGIASHQGRPRSPSLPEPRDPPFPIPTRASSRRPPFSASAPSDGQRSPTKMDAPWHRRGIGRSHYRAGSVHRTNSIRKVRSAAALPRNQRSRRQGSRSPPPFSETTEAPESPSLPPLPYNDITSPRYDTSSHYRSHKSRLSTTTARTATTDVNSVGGASNGASQATGVVDAIAQTMVGEWMFKYVRRRKSFGVPDSGKDDSSNDRHKRWVWLAPYERAILWSSKQPSSGSALMGKTGRKLTIQSVLDVKDDNPAPKNQGAVFNRSILILTPQRALKFTATSSERHYVWLTALSFLAHSTQAIPEIIATPQPVKETTVPDFEPPQPTRRPGIRDSIRLTKSKAPPSVVRSAGPPSIPSVPSIPSSRTGDASGYRHAEAFATMPNNNHQREQSGDAAEPPFIPRFTERSNQTTVHGRKRSNTGGHVPPPLSFRGFSGPGSVGQHSYTNSNAGNSVGTAGSSDIYQSQPSQGSSRQSWGISTAGSQRTSEASSRPGGNFFDAIGTVRMEAFISPLAYSGFDRDPDEHEEYRYRARRRSKELRRRQSRSRHRDSYSSRGTRGTDGYHGGSRVAGEEDYFRDDPFKGF
ncbi:Putative pleckstrin domain, Mcp5-type [Colletotrichum destructivum]|uniref:Pleckstrin domain, Mcp5-type n=1 Tax=Colletotrichum destructivum TaxID=34406 RepID=A0AAX4J0L0_9PEZI|nr:Putative pleckstrin domain, Mcp5-type [Colletotrichum destructivum]